MCARAKVKTSKGTLRWLNLCPKAVESHWGFSSSALTGWKQSDEGLFWQGRKAMRSCAECWHPQTLLLALPFLGYSFLLATKPGFYLFSGFIIFPFIFFKHLLKIHLEQKKYSIKISYSNDISAMSDAKSFQIINYILKKLIDFHPHIIFFIKTEILTVSGTIKLNICP